MRPEAASRRLGAVLAGGASRRLGRDKALERVGRGRMVDRAVGALRPRCAEVVVVSSRPETPTGLWRVVPDRRTSAGPLGGIEAALLEAEALEADAVFVLACDLPLVGVEVVDSVLDALEDAPAAAASRHGDPPFEPLCAVYRTACRATATQLLDAGERSARALFEALGGRAVQVPGHLLLNVNTEAELALARDRSHPGRAGGPEGSSGGQEPT
jgi:molybdenum cofactor guanylyltransferase